MLRLSEGSIEQIFLSISNKKIQREGQLGQRGAAHPPDGLAYLCSWQILNASDPLQRKDSGAGHSTLGHQTGHAGGPARAGMSGHPPMGGRARANPR